MGRDSTQVPSFQMQHNKTTNINKGKSALSKKAFLKLSLLLIFSNLHASFATAQVNLSNAQVIQAGSQIDTCTTLGRPSEECISQYFTKDAIKGCEPADNLRGDVLDLTQDSHSLLPIDYIMAWEKIKESKQKSQDILPFDLINVKNMVMNLKDYWDVLSPLLKIHEWRATPDCRKWISSKTKRTQASNSATALLKLHKILRRKSMKKKLILFGGFRLSPIGFMTEDPLLSYRFFSSQITLEHNFYAVLESIQSIKLAVNLNDESTRLLKQRLITLQDDLRTLANYTSIIDAMIEGARVSIDTNPRFCCIIPIGLGLVSCIWNTFLTIILLSKCYKSKKDIKGRKKGKRKMECPDERQATYHSSRFLALPKERVILGGTN